MLRYARDVLELILILCSALLALGTCSGCGISHYSPRSQDLITFTLFKDIKVAGEYVMEDGTVVRFDLTSAVQLDQFGAVASSMVREATRQTLQRERQRVARERERGRAGPTTNRSEP